MPRPDLDAIEARVKAAMTRHQIRKGYFSREDSEYYNATLVDGPALLAYVHELEAELNLLRRRWAHVERACTQYGQYTPVDLRDTARHFERDGLLGLGAFLRGIAEAKGEK